MRTLEEEAGCQLIRRQAKKSPLTEAGERLLRFARPFLQEMSVVREELSGFEKFSGAYKVGGGQQACRFFLLLSSKNLRRAYLNAGLKCMEKILPSA